MNFTELKDLILRFKKVQSKYPSLVSHLPANQYDIFKRYTSTQKDHAPQMRASRNARRKLPIVGQTSSLIPFKDGDCVLKKGREFGEKGTQRYSLIAPDWWSLQGPEASIEETEALMGFEVAKVRRYFGTKLGKLQFCKALPIRRRLKMGVTLADVPRSKINDTIFQALLPCHVTPEITRNASLSASNELAMTLKPLINMRSLTNLIHLARGMITPNFKWVPTLSSVNATTAEILHLVTSPYFQASTLLEEDYNIAALESLCHDLVKHCLLDRNPRALLSLALSAVTIGQKILKDFISESGGSRGFTNICRVAAGLPLLFSQKVNDTDFTVIEGCAKPVPEVLIWGMPAKERRWTWWKGEEFVFFENGATKGLLHRKDREVIKVSLDTQEETVFPILYDIALFCRALRTGFDVGPPDFCAERDFGWVTKAYHFREPAEVIMAFGPSDTPGWVSLNGLVDAESPEGSLTKIVKLTSVVQPYVNPIRAVKNEVNDRLEVVDIDSGETILDPAHLSAPRMTPHPAGLDLGRAGLYGLMKNPRKRFATALRDITHTPAKLQRLHREPDSADVDLKSALSAVITKRAHTHQYHKRKLDALHSETDTPIKRIKVAYHLANLYSQAPQTNSIDQTQVAGGGCLDEKFRTGLLVANRRGIFANEEELFNITSVSGNYRMVSMKETKPELPEFQRAEEGIKAGSNLFCVQHLGVWRVYQAKLRPYEANTDVARALNNLDERSTQQVSRRY